MVHVRTSAAPTDPPPHTNSICLCFIFSTLVLILHIWPAQPTEKHIRADITRSRTAPRGENKASDRSIHDPSDVSGDICGSVRGGSAHSLNSFLNILEADHVFFFHSSSQVV